MGYFDPHQPRWLKKLEESDRLEKSRKIRHRSKCHKCGNELIRDELHKCSGRVRKSLKGSPGEYKYKSPIQSTIQELSGKTLGELAILPRNEGELDVILRALEILGLEDRALKGLQDAYQGRFNREDM